MDMDIGIEAVTGLIGEGAIFTMADTMVVTAGMVDTEAISNTISEQLVRAIFL
jgi:hypothetical protein